MSMLSIIILVISLVLGVVYYKLATSLDRDYWIPVNQNHKWTNGTMRVVNFQGIMSSQTQLAKVVGSSGFLATTGEWVTIGEYGIELFKSEHVKIATELEEIVLGSNDYEFKLLGFPFHLTTRLANYNYGIRVFKQKNQLSKGTVLYHHVIPSLVNLGQERDMEIHRKKYLAWSQDQNSSSPYVLFGCSRGTAATFNALATYHYPNVKLMILEGSFTSIQDVLHERYGKIFGDLAIWLLERLTEFRRDGPSPASLVSNLPSNIPVAFITSLADTEVPAILTQKLHDLVKANGNPVHLLVLKKSTHSYYPLHNKEDRESYEKFIHSLYKKYELPHKEIYT